MLFRVGEVFYYRLLLQISSFIQLFKGLILLIASQLGYLSISHFFIAVDVKAKTHQLYLHFSVSLQITHYKKIDTLELQRLSTEMYPSNITCSSLLRLQIEFYVHYLFGYKNKIQNYSCFCCSFQFSFHNYQIQIKIAKTIFEMKIEFPNDYQYTEADLKANTFRIPKTLYLLHKVQKQKKIEIKSEKQTPPPPKNPNYFQQMYKSAKKKMYINLFIRKLKQATILKHPLHHQLCQPSDSTHGQLLKTFKFNYTLEIIYTILEILYMLIASITTSLIVVFPHVNQTNFVKIISLITVIWCGLSLFVNIFGRSSIDVINQHKNFKYIRDVYKNIYDGWLWLDFSIMIVFLVDSLAYTQYFAYLKMVIMIKLGRILNKVTNLQILLIQNCFREQFWELIKTFFYNFLYAHFLAIILLFMADPSSSWLTHKGLHDSQWYEQYVWAYYWATTTMLTVGFGDIVPTNAKEALVMIFIETLSCIVLAYNVNSIGNIIKKITSYEQEKVSNLKIFTQMQRRENVSEDIKKKVTNYITQSAELKRNFNVTEEKHLLEKLPKSFYEQFRKEANINIFNDIPFFRNLRLDILQQIALKIDKKLTHPEEIILQSGSVPGVCIVNNGHIVLSMNRLGLNAHGKEIQQIKISAQEFRILSLYFFINKPINYDIKCKDYAIIYSMNKIQLQSILSTSPSSYEYYCMAKDKDRFNPNDWQTQKCQLCENRSHHTLNQCPKLHYVPIKGIVISRALTRNPENLQRIHKTGRHGRYKTPNVHALKAYTQVLKAHQQFDLLSLVQGHRRRQLLVKSHKNVHIYQPKVKNTEIFAQYLEENAKCYCYQDQNSKTLEGMLNLKYVCNEVSEKLKDQLLRTQFIMTKGYQSEIQSDIAHNYTSYFHTFNPSMLAKRNISLKKIEKNINQSNKSN